LVITMKTAHNETGVTQSAGALPGAMLDAMRVINGEAASEQEAFNQAAEMSRHRG